MNEKNFVNGINKTESRGIKFAAQEVVEGGGEKELKSLTREEKERREDIRKKLVGAINGALKQDGFEKESSTWRRETKDVSGKDVIQVVNLQRGEYAFWYFLNIGVFKKELDPENKKPHTHECHYDERFEYLDKGGDSEEAQKQAREKSGF